MEEEILVKAELTDELEYFWGWEDASRGECILPADPDFKFFYLSGQEDYEESMR